MSGFHNISLLKGLVKAIFSDFVKNTRQQNASTTRKWENSILRTASREVRTTNIRKMIRIEMKRKGSEGTITAKLPNHPVLRRLHLFIFIASFPQKHAILHHKNCISYRRYYFVGYKKSLVRRKVFGNFALVSKFDCRIVIPVTL